MTNDTERFREVPAAAMTFAAGAIEVGDNGAGAKTAPVKLVARSSQPINHWYWGNVVHDLDSVQLHKSRIPLDYIHDENTVLGYLNHPTVGERGLELSGAIIPFRDDDKASEVLFKMRAGVPYEASIDFTGGHPLIEEVADGDSVEVNGFTFAGPGTVIRNWSLRGVAVCPYGADMNTESAANFKSGDKVTVEFKQVQGDTEMADVTNTEAAVESASEEVATVAAVETELAQEVAATAEVEIDTVVDPREEFQRMLTDFGSDIATSAFSNGLGYDEARELFFEQLAADNAALRLQLDAAGGGDTEGATFTEATEDPDEARRLAAKTKLDETGMIDARAKFATNLTFIKKTTTKE